MNITTLAKSLAALSLISAAPVFAQFTNGGFEDGSFNAWTRGAGYVYTSNTLSINPNDFLPSGSRYNASYDASGIVTAGLDPRTDNNLNMVYSGTYSARVNNHIQNNSISVISQTVTNYQDSNIFFAWAAVLEESHGTQDSDLFSLTLRDDTTNSIIYSASYSSAAADTAALFTESTSGWFYTAWQVQNIDVSALIGHTFTLTLAGIDCPYGGHAGYVYLDGFGAVAPPPGPGQGAVPEPSTYGLMGAAALLAMVAYRRKFAKKA
jgi:hypothetical protein